MAEVVLLCGPPGSGKTTYARALSARGYEVCSYDAEAWRLGVRRGVADAVTMATAHERITARLAEAIGSGRSVVLDAALSSRAIRDEFRALGAAHGASVRLVVFHAPLPMLQERVAGRVAGQDSVVLSAAAVAGAYAAFEWPTPDESPQCP